MRIRGHEEKEAEEDPIPSSVIPSGVCMARMPIPSGQIQVIWPLSPMPLVLVSRPPGRLAW
jgi:hypothetical protein